MAQRTRLLTLAGMQCTLLTMSPLYKNEQDSDDLPLIDFLVMAAIGLVCWIVFGVSAYYYWQWHRGGGWF
jgi:hypothetical protein